MPEGSARAETYNPVLNKLEILNVELKKLADRYDEEVKSLEKVADSLGLNVIRFWEKEMK